MPALYAVCFCTALEAKPVASGEVWRKAEELGRVYTLDPLLIYSIACAESSLDDRADSGYARGLMQVSRATWEDMTTQSYDKAWEWQTNMEVAAKYLGSLRSRLERSGRYSWPILAASYHYGLGKVSKARYRISSLPGENNRIYKSLLAGHTPDLPGAVPFREIDRLPVLRMSPRPLPEYAVAFEPLDVAVYDFEEPLTPPVPVIVLPELSGDTAAEGASDVATTAEIVPAPQADAVTVLQPFALDESTEDTTLPKVPELISFFGGEDQGPDETTVDISTLVAAGIVPTAGAEVSPVGTAADEEKADEAARLDPSLVDIVPAGSADDFGVLVDYVLTEAIVVEPEGTYPTAEDLAKTTDSPLPPIPYALLAGHSDISAAEE